MLRISHRGSHALVPENTLAAFSAAIELKVDGIETDVRLSEDGVPVLFHDRFVADGRPVAKLTHRDLSRAAGYAVPSLEAALDQFDGILWNIELKVVEGLDAILDVLSHYMESRRILVSSFWHTAVETTCARLDVDGALLIAHRPCRHVSPQDWIPRLSRIGTLIWDYETCDAGLLKLSAEEGLQNFVYGAVSVAELLQLQEWGVDGAITDYPERIP